MLGTKRMKKARIIVLKSAVGHLIRDLHEAGLVDIRKSAYSGLEEGRPLSNFDGISSELLNLRGMLTVMEANTRAPDAEPRMIHGDVAIRMANDLRAVGASLRELARKRSILGEEIKSIEGKITLIRKLRHFKDVDFGKLMTKTVSFKVGAIASSKIPKLEKELERAEGESNIISERETGITLILYCRANEATVENVLSESGFSEYEIPEGTTTPDETLAMLNASLSEKKAQALIYHKEIEGLSNRHIGDVLSIKKSLDIEAERASISNRFSSSKKLFVVEGWIVSDDYAKLSGIVAKFGSDAVLQEASFGHDEMPPTVLDNPNAASPFEFLTKSYSLPNYFELDPTIMYFIFLPIIYGMIVGDVLYGVASIVLGFLLMQKFKKSYVMSNVSRIWMFSGFPTIVFGIIFDEWGGMSHYKLLEYFGKWLGADIVSGPLYGGFHRIENVLALVAISALVGMIHLAIGFALGAINEWHHNKKHSIAKIAWIGVEVGMLLALLGAIGVAESAFVTAGIVLLVICIITLGATEGIIGIIEIPGLLGNILSYTRIAAIGIVGIIIAELLNEFIIPLPSQGIMALILVPVFFALHIVNAFIAMFESLVQGGRLNIVEFRSKFLHGGGEVFSPFTLKK